MDIDGGARHDDFQRRVEGIAAVIKHLPEWGTLARPTRLHAVDGIEGLVEPQTHGKGDVDPRRTSVLETRVVVQQRQYVDDDKGQAGERDEIGGHRRREEQQELAPVWFENIFRQQRLVDARIFVELQIVLGKTFE